MPRTDSNVHPAEPADGTHDRIVQAARDLVVEHGYDDVSTAQVLERAGVSRGGLYHHFSGKDELMAAVLEAVERDFTLRLAAAVADAPDPYTALSDGVQWYLDECIRSRELQRVGLYEGRKALGWHAWRETIAPHGLAILTASLDAAIQSGELQPADPDALAHMILAPLHEAVTLILADPDPPRRPRADRTDRRRHRQRTPQDLANHRPHTNDYRSAWRLFGGVPPVRWTPAD